MPIKVEFSNDDVTALISGDIDHHSARDLREEIDNIIIEKTPKTLTLDFSQVGFMDSSGIGLVIGRFKSMQEVNGKVIVQNPPHHIKKVMKLAGIDKLAKITTNME